MADQWSRVVDVIFAMVFLTLWVFGVFDFKITVLGYLALITFLLADVN